MIMVVDKLRTTAYVTCVATFIVACGPQSRQPTPEFGEGVNIEGLAQVQARNFEVALARPGVRFNEYDKVRVSELELAFRTPDRAQNEFPLGEDQKTRLRAAMATAFGKELGNLQSVEVVNDPGPAVLDLNVRVQDIVASSPGRRVGAMGRASFAIETAGEMTLVIELRDSQSEEVLVRVFDRQAVEGAAMLQGDAVISTWEGVERLVARWAARVASGLDELVKGRY